MNGNLTISRMICVMVTRLAQPSQGETARRRGQPRSLRGVVSSTRLKPRESDQAPDAAEPAFPPLAPLAAKMILSALSNLCESDQTFNGVGS